MGATEVFSTASPLLKETLSFADGFMYMKMQLPKEIEMKIMWGKHVEKAFVTFNIRDSTYESGGTQTFSP